MRRTIVFLLSTVSCSSWVRPKTKKESHREEEHPHGIIFFFFSMLGPEHGQQRGLQASTIKHPFEVINRKNIIFYTPRGALTRLLTWLASGPHSENPVCAD